MLREKYWSGLGNEKVITATNHRYDSGATFNDLQVACQAVELHSGFNKLKPPSSYQLTAPEVNKLDAIDV